MAQASDGDRRGIRGVVLLWLIVGSLLVSMAFAYIAVVTQNPKASTEPLYGPGDYVTQSQ